MQRDTLLEFSDKYLNSKDIKDYTVNGLQVAGCSEIQKIVTAVTASLAAIEYAAEVGAQMLLVHHGYFWKGEDPALVGMKGRRICALMAHQLNLVAYHLPLDMHQEIGNNRLLANCFGVDNPRVADDKGLLWRGELAPISLGEFALRIEQALKRKCVIIGDKDKIIQKPMWCSGAAHDSLLSASAKGADVFISGEYAERTYYEALETGCAYISAGHHATERLGVRKLGELLAERFSLSVEFFDEPNPF